MMIDFHSHVLPAMDDGAKDVTMSLAMLTLAAKQGVDTVVATPHFYKGEDTPASFLARRQRCFETLQPQLTAQHPRILLGAEVLAWEGMSAIDLRPFCLEGTEVLLVELPFAKLPFWMVEELENVILEQNLTVMLAHLDRYQPWHTKDTVATLLDLPDVMVQVNCEVLKDRATFHGLQKHIGTPERLVLGSDMHNLTTRAPMMDKAIRTLSHGRSGRIWTQRIEQATDYVFNKQTVPDFF